MTAPPPPSIIGFMAKSWGNVAQPTDTPIVRPDGTMHKESDFHGNAKHYAAVTEPESPLRQSVGDLGEMHIQDFDSRAIPVADGPGGPFAFAKVEPEGPKLSTASARLGSPFAPPGLPPGWKIGKR